VLIFWGMGERLRRIIKVYAIYMISSLGFCKLQSNTRGKTTKLAGVKDGIDSTPFKEHFRKPLGHNMFSATPIFWLLSSACCIVVTG
jgi:hypothetical protein